MVLPSMDKASMERALRAQKQNADVTADHHCMLYLNYFKLWQLLTHKAVN